MCKVSVLIAVYNRAYLLRNCLLSLMKQSYQPDELIINDDGSQEDIYAEIRQMCAGVKYKVRHVFQQDKGFRLAKCRNNGVKASSGDYLIFLDQDCVYTKNFIRTFVENRKERQFCVAYPLRLDAQQSQKISKNIIETFNFKSIITEEQLQKVKKQYKKDKLYYYLKKLHLRTIGPKLRGGVTAVNRGDFIRVNGYDENYKGWGNEDDDLGHRLYKSGVIGKNLFHSEYPIHLHHDLFHDGERVNDQYYRKKRPEIKKGQYRCEFGYDNPLDNDEPTIRDVN